MADEGDGDGARNRRDATHQIRGPDAVTPGNPYHLSKGMRAFVGIVAVILVITMTGLFVLRVVQW